MNKEELTNNYFNNLDDKYLIITGTVPMYSTLGKEKFEDIIKQVVNEYGGEYKILFKPHPRAVPTEEQEQFLNSLGIKVLPAAIPIEAIMIVYPNLKLGGFASTLYLSAMEKDKVLFFFARSKLDLVQPLDELYDQVFSNAKFYY